MTETDVLNLTLQSDPEILPDLRQQVREWAAARGWSEDQRAEIALAVDEAVSNVIRHAYDEDCDQRIVFQARPFSDTRGSGVEIQIRDFGRQVDPKMICGRNLDDVRPGGLGVHIIRAMMSEVRYETARGGGMRLVMRKYRNHTAGDAQANNHG